MHWCTIEWVDLCFDRGPNDSSTGNVKCLQFMVRLCSPIWLQECPSTTTDNINNIISHKVRSNKLIGYYLLIRYTRLELIECLINNLCMSLYRILCPTITAEVHGKYFPLHIYLYKIVNNNKLFPFFPISHTNNSTLISQLVASCVYHFL